MSPPLPTTSSPPLPAAHRCCALDAEGQETKVHLAVAGEGFTATGLMVTHRHFLEVYRYQGWGGQEALPLFQQGQTFQPAAIELKQVGACRQWEISIAALWRVKCLGWPTASCGYFDTPPTHAMSMCPPVRLAGHDRGVAAPHRA